MNINSINYPTCAVSSVSHVKERLLSYLKPIIGIVLVAFACLAALYFKSRYNSLREGRAEPLIPQRKDAPPKPPVLNVQAPEPAPSLPSSQLIKHEKLAGLEDQLRKLESLQSFKCSKVSDEVVLEKQSQIVAVNSKHGTVNLKDLQKNGLLPTHQMTLGDVTYFCSDIFKFDKHFAVVGLVEIEGQVFPRIFYHSHSQGTWRVIPFASKTPLEEFNDEDPARRVWHFGKGQCETDVQLPIALIAALNHQSYEGVKINQYPAERMIVTLKRDTDLLEAPSFCGLVQIEQFTNVQEEPGAEIHRAIDGYRPPHPSSISLPNDKNLLPDFANGIEFQQSLPSYGAVTVKIFPSQNKEILYMFYEAADGRAFLASVESTKKTGINSFGVRDKILNLGYINIPLLEYRGQIHREFYPTKPGENLYQDQTNYYFNNWNYLKELEIIKMYYSEQGRSMPETL